MSCIFWGGVPPESSDCAAAASQSSTDAIIQHQSHGCCMMPDLQRPCLLASTACPNCRSLHSSRSSKIVHRLAVFNKAGDVEHVVSQSDVIR